MAATVAITGKDHAGNRRITEGTVTLDSTYVNGTGEAVTAAAMGLRTVEAIVMDTDDGYIPTFTPSADKTTGTVKLLFGNYAAANGPLIEAANFDASGVVLKFVARGKA